VSRLIEDRIKLSQQRELSKKLLDNDNFIFAPEYHDNILKHDNNQSMGMGIIVTIMF